MDLEVFILKCRPFYLPHEFSASYIMAVYVHLQANAKLAMGKLHDDICKQQNRHTESIFIEAGDFNHTSLKTFTKYVDNMQQQESGSGLHKRSWSVQGRNCTSS